MAVDISGLVRVADDAYLTEPTRSHVVLVQAEAGRWIAWAGRYHERTGGKPNREWMLYGGTSLQAALRAALRAATRFAGRFRHVAIS